LFGVAVENSIKDSKIISFNPRPNFGGIDSIKIVIFYG
jgi:hypothetical protein